MRGDLGDRFRVVEIVSVFRVLCLLFVGFRHRDAKLAGSFSNLATELPEVGVLANPLGNDVGRSTQCIFVRASPPQRRVNAALRVL